MCEPRSISRHRRIAKQQYTMKKRTLTLLLSVLLGGALHAETPDPLVWQVLRKQYERVTPTVSDGRILVARGGKFGFTDAQGQVAIPLIYDNAFSFKNGVATVGTGKNPDCKFGLIAPDGTMIAALEWDYLGAMSAGYAVAYKRDGAMRHYVLIDSKGAVKELPYDYCDSYANGLAVVGKGTFKQALDSHRAEFVGKYGYITPDGVEAIPLQFDDAKPFREYGLAAVGMQGKYYIKWGFIDQTGKFVIPCNYYAVQDFSGGLAQVAKVIAGGELSYGYINAQGEEVIPCRYDTATNFVYTNTWVGTQTDGEMHYTLIDRKGNAILPFTVQNLQEGGKLGLAVASTAGDAGQLRYGILNNAGKVVLPFEYDQITIFSERDPQSGEWVDGAMATKNGESFSFDISPRKNK